MIKSSKFLFLIVFLLSATGIVYGSDTEQVKDARRYALYEMTINEKPAPVLLDTQTGKVWIYQEDKVVSFSGDKFKFKGVSVEGLVYSTKEAEILDKQINAWRDDGLLGKEKKGSKEAIASEFSYVADHRKANKIGTE